MKRISCLLKFSRYLNVQERVLKNKEGSRNTILQFLQYYTV